MWRTSSGLKAQILDLHQRRLAPVGGRSHSSHEAAPQPLDRIAHIFHPHAGIHQHQPVIAFNQQAVADHVTVVEQRAVTIDQGCAVRAHGAAVEVMNP
jgi:hypothetical protein